MATLILGPGGTPQGVMPYIKRNAAALGLADRFLYFAFDVDRAIENHDSLLPEERLWLRMADRADLRHHTEQWHLDPELLAYVHEKGTRGVRALGAFFATFNWQDTPARPLLAHRARFTRKSPRKGPSLSSAGALYPRNQRGASGGVVSVAPVQYRSG